MTKYLAILLVLCTPLSLWAEASIEILGWSTSGKLALQIVHENPFNGYDASYLLVNLLDDEVIVQFDVMNKDNSAEHAKNLLTRQWQAPFQIQMTQHQIRPAGNHALRATFSAAGKSFSLAHEAHQLILRQGKSQKIVAQNLAHNAELIASYLSPHESRIAIIVKEHQRIRILGSNLLVGFR
ncbi:hypothetical protein [Entomospira culicis]|uniref:Uncharacterized protein n=2 Tax=Entomospira culicis TaxID=2719989 RepID=A0A968GKL7_9SPIO|nr:hypothetical protein [Entomospira culicis]NIZ19530.1 hypothetical protein [Entomospira culicis]NIZ69565.1 hypothetical protein [Entomospira culicis]WDI38305.1 hypothetical protein PVA47_04960 [Entomospira culicis]